MTFFDSLKRTRRATALCGVVLASALTAGCSAVGSLPVDFQASGAEPINGWSYSLPKGVFQVTLLEQSSTDRSDFRPFQIVVAAEGPYFVADPNHTYRLDFDVSASHSEILSVSYYRDTPFLREIRFRSSNAVDEALVAAATDARRIALATGLESLEAIEGKVAGPFTVDLMSAVDRDRTERVMTTALKGFLELVVDDCVLNNDVSDRCNAAIDLLGEVERVTSQGGSFVHFEVEMLGAPGVEIDESPRSDRLQIRSCSEGVCYRPFVPHILTVTVGPDPDMAIGRARAQFTVALPSGSAPLAMPLDRPLLAERGGAILFDYPGVPAAMLTFRESDTAEAIVLPFEVVGAAVGATVSNLQPTSDQTGQAIAKVQDVQAGAVPVGAGLSSTEVEEVRKLIAAQDPANAGSDAARRPVRRLCGEPGVEPTSAAVVPATFIGTCTRGEAAYPPYYADLRARGAATQRPGVDTNGGSPSDILGLGDDDGGEEDPDEDSIDDPLRR